MRLAGQAGVGPASRSEDSPLLEADRAACAVAGDDVIEDGDAEELAGRGDASSQAVIFGARFRIAARVVVAEDDRDGAGQDGGTEDPARVHEGVGEGADAHGVDGDRLAADIEEEAVRQHLLDIQANVMLVAPEAEVVLMEVYGSD